MKALRPYQKEAFDLVWNRIEGKIEKRALIVLATGLGKTVLAAALARRWFSQRTGRILFLAHTVGIVRQARKEFREVLHELTTTGILTGEEAEGLDAHVLFATFQSMQSRLDSVKSNAFGLLIVDEAHHGTAVTFKKVIEHFTPEFLLGMTATPDRHEGEDIRDIFGQELCAFPLQWGILEGWLAPVEYQMLTDNISIKRLRELIRQVHEGVRVSRKAIDATIFLPERTEVIVDIVRKAQEGGKRTLLFCRSVEHLNHVLALFPEALAYHSEISEKELRQRFDDFREGRIQTLATIDMFNEGIDIPDAELVVFLRATKSRLLWLQQLGRGLHSRKKVLVLDFVANCKRVQDARDLNLAPRVGFGDDQEHVTIDNLNLNVEFSQELQNLIGLLDFLDMGFYQTHEEARAAVIALNPPWEGNLKDWYRGNYRRVPRLHSNPLVFYRSRGWVSLPHFCGREFYSFEEARALVQSHNPPWNVNLLKWYQELCKRMGDPRLPSAPNGYYKDSGWVSWPHFCGHAFYSFEEARALVQSHNPPWEGSLSRWYQELRKRLGDPRLPSHLDILYKDSGWVSWPHFCGREFYSFEEARALVQSHNPPWKESLSPWYQELCKRLGDPRLPSYPYAVYKDSGWVNWAHFCDRESYSFEEARALVQSNNPPWKGSLSEWYRALRERLGDPRLPFNPDLTYQTFGWVSWPHFCGREFYSLEEARVLVQSYNPPWKGNLWKWYFALRKRLGDSRLPSNLHVVYKDSNWVGMPHFCGRENG